MRLTYQKVVRIVKRRELGLSSGFVARQFGISRRRVEQIYAYYKRTGDYIELKRPGRKAYRKYPEEIEKKVLELNKKYRWGATYIAKYLRDKEKIRIANTFVHNILLKHNMAIPNKNKQKRRAPWIRYEREHSLSLVHLDWHYNPVLNKWVCAVLDDASRKVLCGGEFDNAFEDYAIDLLNKAYNDNLRIRPIEQAITDHGPQFYANKQNKDNTAKTKFQLFCEKKGIKHILCKYHHPQSNGKYEKWNHTYQLYRHNFASFQEFVSWYNNRPHGSLNFMTPEHAFYVKLQDFILGGFLKWAEKI